MTGNIVEINNPNGNVTRFEYYADANDINNYGRLWKTIVDYNTSNGLNLATKYKYDAAGNVIEIKDPNGDVSKSHN